MTHTLPKFLRGSALFVFLFLFVVMLLIGVSTERTANAFHLPDETAGHSTSIEDEESTSNDEEATQNLGSTKLENPLKFSSIVDFLKAILDIVIVFAVPIIVFFIIWAGFLYVTAQGDPGKIKDARVALTWTVIGGVLILGAWVLVEVIQGTVDALR